MSPQPVARWPVPFVAPITSTISSWLKTLVTLVPSQTRPSQVQRRASIRLDVLHVRLLLAHVLLALLPVVDRRTRLAVLLCLLNLGSHAGLFPALVFVKAFFPGAATLALGKAPSTQPWRPGENSDAAEAPR
ncbi:unnamed protein product [Symbiodinium microadriaticum]|nr:unnamed protein product [Symbiodinium microadriaticum]